MISTLRSIATNDRVLAAGTLVLGEVEALLLGNLGEPRWLSGAAMVPLAGALLLRRAAPLVAQAVVFASILAWTGIAELLGYRHETPESLAMLVVWIVPVYSVAAYSKRTAALAGLFLALMSAGLGSLVFSPSDELSPVQILFIAIPWAAGRALRQQRRQAAELRELTVALEREREERARRAVAEERVRIARELHDVVAHGVSVMVVQAGAGEGYVREDPHQAEAAFDSIRTAGMQALGELRRMLGLLRSSDQEPETDPQPGLGQAGVLVDSARLTGMDVELAVDGEARPLPPGLDLAAYRVVQEALTNVVKHADGASARVAVRYLPDALELEVTNDAPANGGGPVSREGAGHGQIGMRERVALYGGSLDVGPDPGGGYHVRVRLPLEEPVRR